MHHPTDRIAHTTAFFKPVVCVHLCVCFQEKRFITEHAQLDLLTSARRNVVRVSSDDVTVEELTQPPV